MFLRHLALTQDLVPDLDLISNDNAFLNTLDNSEFMNVPFDQRTLLTRLADGLLVPKPIFHLWTLLALQGKRFMYRQQFHPVVFYILQLHFFNFVDFEKFSS